MASIALERPTVIDVVSDVVCPWCYIGRRRLGAALSSFAQRVPEFAPRVLWRPFQLNPDVPREGIDRRAYLAAKFGTPERIAQIYDNISAIGKAVGIDFAFDRIERQPNTLDAHRLIEWAQARGSAEDLVEQLFRAYFLQGRFIGDRDVLGSIADEAGLPGDEARAHLASDAGAEQVAAMDRRVRELGVSGVPLFVFDGKIAVSGAQEPAVLEGALAQAREAR